MPWLKRKPRAMPTATMTIVVVNTRIASAIMRPTRPDALWVGVVANRLSNPLVFSPFSPTALTIDPNIAPTSAIMGTVPYTLGEPVAAEIELPSTTLNMRSVKAG